VSSLGGSHLHGWGLILCFVIGFLVGIPPWYSMVAESHGAMSREVVAPSQFFSLSIETVRISSLYSYSISFNQRDKLSKDNTL
jgi:hypothetical protein